MYCMVCTRSDLADAMSVTSRFMANPGKDHWAAVKWIFRYLKRSINMVLVYSGASVEEEPNIPRLTDANYATNLDKRRSFIRCVFKLWNSTIS